MAEPNIKNNWKETTLREVADLYGRYNPDKYRKVWEQLSGGRLHPRKRDG